jgi:CheY-like chemotaxis protein
MPEMDGTALLARIRAIAPDTVRMMLTGHADLEAAVEAINQGNIFRLLTKPCHPDQMRASLRAALEQHALVIAERELLEQTLAGTTTVLAEILALVNPAAFGRGARIKKYVRHLAGALSLPNPWRYELAASLSQIGCVAVASDTIDRALAGRELSEEEARTFAAHPEVARQLLARIPRLEEVALMIAAQRMVPASRSEDLPPGAELGGQLLRIALAFDQLLVEGHPPAEAIEALESVRPAHHPALVRALRTLKVETEGDASRVVTVRTLEVGMVLDEDVRATGGMLLVARGHEVTHTLILRLRGFASTMGVVQPFRVRVTGGRLREAA